MRGVWDSFHIEAKYYFMMLPGNPVTTWQKYQMRLFPHLYALIFDILYSLKYWVWLTWYLKLMYLIKRIWMVLILVLVLTFSSHTRFINWNTFTPDPSYDQFCWRSTHILPASIIVEMAAGGKITLGYIEMNFFIITRQKCRNYVGRKKKLTPNS